MKRSTFKTAAVAAGTVALVAALAACAPAAQEPAAAPSGEKAMSRGRGSAETPSPIPSASWWRNLGRTSTPTSTKPIWPTSPTAPRASRTT